MGTLHGKAIKQQIGNIFVMSSSVVQQFIPTEKESTGETGNNQEDTRFEIGKRLSYFLFLLK